MREERGRGLLLDSIVMVKLMRRDQKVNTGGQYTGGRVSVTLDFGLEPALVVQFAGRRENGDPDPARSSMKEGVLSGCWMSDNSRII